jgi:hypothetical protein
MKTLSTVLLLLATTLTGFAQIGADSIVIPLEGNSWSTSDNARVVYFRLKYTGPIRCTTGSFYISTYNIKDTGYQNLTLMGRDVETITLKGAATRDANFVPNNEGNFFYWGRRGPSVHLNYSIPESANAEWFYNEVFVPTGQDVEGSYFMADGFSQGYFGMQVNSPTERRILFSVWSPFKTDDPKNIPDSQKIVLTAKGPKVHAGEFGNEGSGGQSYLVYPWRSGNTYRFLLHAQPLEHHATQFTAWFFAPEEGEWRLIASFRRPQTRTWLTGLHSFLENFEPAMGNKGRYVLFDHQWIRTDQGQWISLTKARFTGDNTARKGYRMDYAGGIKGTAFFLQNCGFFSDYTPLDTWFERHPGPKETPPDINLDHLGHR